MPESHGVEIINYSDLETARAESDLIVEGAIESVEISELTFGNTVETFAVAEIYLTVANKYESREPNKVPSTSQEESYEPPTPPEPVRVYWSLGYESRAQQDLVSLREKLPKGTSWWFLARRDGLPDGYGIIGTMAILEVAANGKLAPALYPETAARIGAGDPPDKEDSIGSHPFVRDMATRDVEDLRRDLNS